MSWCTVIGCRLNNCLLPPYHPTNQMSVWGELLATCLSPSKGGGAIIHYKRGMHLLLNVIFTIDIIEVSITDTFYCLL